jgi:hypothetical protein
MSYSGDANYGASQGGFGLNVLYPTTTIVSAAPQRVQYPNSVTLTAIVDTTNTSLAPRGDVTFAGVTEGPIAGTVTYALITDGSGNSALQAELTYSPSFSETVSASFGGDFNYATSTSAGLVVTVNGGPAPGIAFPQTPSPISISSPGLSGITAVQVTSVAGFSGTVNFTCAVPSTMKEASCSFSPPHTPINSQTAGNTTLGVDTVGPHSAVLPHTPGWLIPGGGFVFAAVLLGNFPLRRRKLWMYAVMSLIFAFILSIVGCGSSSNGGTTDAGTPAGTYTVVVTGTSGPVVQTANVTVNVQ